MNNIQVIYYNNKIIPDSNGKFGTRNEFRATGWGGEDCPLLAADNTGAICVLAIDMKSAPRRAVCWIARSVDEENLVASWLNVDEIEPGQFYQKVEEPASDVNPVTWLKKRNVPEAWFACFPSGREISSFVIHNSGLVKSTADKTLIARRLFEYELFKALENIHTMPRISEGFTTVSDFIEFANSVANRRKSRSGSSLENHLAAIFNAEKIKYSAQAVTEQNKKPDFLFPSAAAYHDVNFRETYPCCLHMMAAKTCCKDRWRQVLNEADYIQGPKHLFTLQEGISENQMNEMTAEMVQLVVPETLHASFAVACRPKLMSLEAFVAMIRQGQQKIPDLEKWTA